MNNLLKSKDVIDALGGTHDVAGMIGVTPNAVINWSTFNSFPADTYVALQEELKLRGLIAPDYLWKMRPLVPVKKRRAA